MCATRTRSSRPSSAQQPAEASEAFQLVCSDGSQAPVLQSVDARGRLDGALFELTLRQTYRNAGERLLEVVYTFPLPTSAVLLGFASELQGQRLEGRVVAKPAAERRYEEALAAGDAPVMLEAGPGGLHTANLGNLKPGEEIVLEVRFTQVLAFEQGRLRLVLPTTIAPRYGSPASSGLQPQQVPSASMAAEYPLTLTVDVAGSLARGTIECPTHDFHRLDTPEGARLTLASGAWLDRDVVFLVKPEIARGSFAVRARDEKSAQAPWVVMAMLQPPPSVPRPAVALKLLVDCSGSMGGDSISSARVALGGLLPGLGGPDYLSLTRFGSTVEHAMRPTACSAPALRRAAFVAQKLDADLGGTEMEAALSAAFELPVPGEIGMADVLLLTDGEVWEVEPMIAAARASRHRVFVIGVGASPAEAPLRALAKATGGACEFATPGEDLEAAAKRMLGRIRQQPLSGLSVDWGSPPVWQSELPQGTFGDDALVVFAGLSSTSQQMPVRLLANGAKGPQELASCSAETMAVSDSLPRLAAARRMAAVDTEHALALAVDYQLMSGQTNCILVHEREGADKASGVAELHRVQSMLAAGWAATGSVVAEAQEGYQDAFAMPSSGGASTTVRMFRSHAPSAFDLVDRFSMGDLDDDTDDVRVAMQAVEPPASLKEIARAVADQLAQGGPVGGLQSYCSALQLPPEVKAALVEAAAICADGGLGWLLMAIWITTRGIGDKDALKVLQPKLAGINQELVDVCMAMFVERLGPIVSAVTSNSRGQRLAQAMDRRGQ